MTYTRRCLLVISVLIAAGGCTYYDACFDRHDHDRGDEDDRCGRGEDCERDAGPREDGPSGEDGGAPAGCSSDAECAPREACVEGECRHEDETCQFDVDCGPDRRCVDAACRPRCTEDAECPSGTRCEAELCLPAVECARDDECESGARCVESRCLPACDGECAHPEDVCGADGLCRPDVSPRPFCTSDAECAESRLCLNGVCRTPCPSGEDVECFGWDSQFVRCGLSESGLQLCFTHHEWSPECRSSADCDSGETCIDAICH